MRMSAPLCLALMLAAAPAAHALDRCDWRAAAWPDDVSSIETGLEAAREAARAFRPDGADIAQARKLLDRAMSPQALGDISGTWKVRSLQVGGDFAYFYPAFRARIGRDGCGYTFAKTTGSQRRTGVLRRIAGEQRALAFLGGATVNNDPVRGYSRLANPKAAARAESDTQGRLVRIGPRELLMVLDVAPGAGRFELYHLQR